LPDSKWYAPEDVKVVARSSGGDCGNLIDLLSLDGQRKYRACHSSELYFNTGDLVKEGQAVGKMGATGFAQGTHLHFVMWVNGNRVDPDKTIKETTMISPKATEYYFKATGQPPATQGDKDYWLNRSPEEQAVTLYNSAPNDTLRKKAAGYDTAVAENTALKAENEKLKQELANQPQLIVLGPGKYQVN
jgi:murein DD-endopeptidase MepM/ murein hydrolase activator NlpD